MRSNCRNCSAPLEEIFADLGTTPLANAFLTRRQLPAMEPFFPLVALVCSSCLLVQLDEYETPDALFSDYAYFSSASTTWLAHAAAFAKQAQERLSLGRHSHVVEIASNDGYLLRYFLDLGIPVLGVEPAGNVAKTATDRGIPTLVQFFGVDTAERLAAEARADLIVANNVLAHVPDLHDFVEGIRILLAPRGRASLEFPHLLRLIEHCQFDTIYHEHFSYFSFLAAEKVLACHGLAIDDVEELATHGGSLRIWARHAHSSGGSQGARINKVLEEECRAGLDSIEPYRRFAARVVQEKRDILRTLIRFKESGASIVGYGAPAKGNTLLNYCGVGRDFLDFTVDVSPHKQGLFLPGTRIAVYPPNEIHRVQPDLVFILPWNLQDEIMDAMSAIREWGGRFLVRRPQLAVIP